MKARVDSLVRTGGFFFGSLVGGCKVGEEEGGVVVHNANSLTCKFLRNHKKLMALGVLRVESLVEREMLLLQREHLLALDIREGCISPIISDPT